MPFVKDDPNINKLDTLPEKFTKEFVDYVCHLYANNTSVLEMSEILNTPQNTIKKYLSNGVVWFNKLNVHDLSAIRTQRASIAKSLHTAEYDFLKNQKSNEKIFLSADDKRFYVYLHRDINGVVFYVGKGTGDRKDSKSGRTKTWHKVAVNGYTKGKKFYFSTYGEDIAIILATEYVTQMKKLITEERTRLEQLKVSMYAIC